MRPSVFAPLFALSLCACTPAGASTESQLGELSEQLERTNDQLAQVNERLIEIEAKLDARGQEVVEALGRRRSPPPPPMPGASSSGSIDMEKVGASITCAKDVCTIKRAALDEILNNPAALVRAARVVPATRDGKPRGFKLYALRPGSLPKMLGFENGDMVFSINGKALDSPDAALETYSSLKDAKAFEIAIERKGEAKILTIRID